jgi:hypothetical protein
MKVNEIKIGEMYGWKSVLSHTTWRKIVKVVAIHKKSLNVQAQVWVSEVTDNRYKALLGLEYITNIDNLMSLDEYMLEQY